MPRLHDPSPDWLVHPSHDRADATRHSAATWCRVEIGLVEPGDADVGGPENGGAENGAAGIGSGAAALRLRIEDDGIGGAAETASGAGLRTMRERAEELDGSLRLAERSPAE